MIAAGLALVFEIGYYGEIEFGPINYRNEAACSDINLGMPCIWYGASDPLVSVCAITAIGHMWALSLHAENGKLYKNIIYIH